MSFRTRLISFFLVIVLAPMLAVGVLVFRLISDSDQAKAQARANGLLTSATSAYGYDEASARGAAVSLARAAANVPAPRLRAVMSQGGLVRVELIRDGRTILDLGNGSAVAPGTAAYRRGRTVTTVKVSATTAGQLAGSLGSGSGLMVREGSRLEPPHLAPSAQLRDHDDQRPRLRGRHQRTAGGLLWSRRANRPVQPPEHLNFGALQP